MTIAARRAIAVSGVVQGVGFRPFVVGLASRLGLCGFVMNDTAGVRIEIEGDANAIDAFIDVLRAKPPERARIDEVRSSSCEPRGDVDFRIAASEASEGVAIVAADTATCDDCLSELFDPNARRFRYPFTNCASCGPRLTIVTDVPYDRARTTMAPFTMCDACKREYDDVTDRRFHAQPIACPRCGPTLRFDDVPERALERAIEAIRRGEIGAFKSLGGYHLVCDAKRSDVVRELRARKRRDDKPFAVMVRDAAVARMLCHVASDEERLLESSARPIVVLERRDCSPSVVSPDATTLGVMLPHTPLQHLLFAGLDEDAVLVMTSGNVSDEPIAYTDEDARSRLRAFADFSVTYDRGVHARCDDSVTRVIAGVPTLLRRSRGYAPEPLSLPSPLAVPTLAVGGDLKSTFALGADRRAIVSHHIGDLAHWEALRSYRAAIEHYERLSRITPVRIVRDRHPDYASTRYALERGVEVIGVQHHHAHMASAIADAGLAPSTRVVAVVFDGTGHGDDGASWGGEFFVGTMAHAKRVAHFEYVAMPGADRAIREPWRMAVAHLVAAGEPPDVGDHDVGIVVRMIERGVNACPTSSVGRLFDAVSALVAACDDVTYEARAAIRLEALAATTLEDGAYEYGIIDGDPIRVDARPIIRAIVRDRATRAVVARRFHTTLAEIVADVCARVAGEVRDVVLSGGVFMNALLAEACVARLERKGFRVHRHRHVPPNDGGLSYGQLAVMCARDAEHV